MRTIVFFDLPNVYARDKRNYLKFRQYLLNEGFLMMQESVYCKMMTSPSMEKSVRTLIHNNKPPKGIVQILSITEKQFVKMDYVVGEFSSDVIDSEERLIIL